MLRQGGVIVRALWPVEPSYWLKALVPAVVLGSLASWLFAMGWVPGAAERLVSEMQEFLAALLAEVDAVMGPGPQFPAPAQFGVLVGVAALGPARVVAPALWPNRPVFLRRVKLSEDNGPDHPEHPNRPLVGREEDRRMRFAGHSAGNRPRWTVVSGPMGVGKTKLAVEWLLECEALGWDAGFLSASTSAEQVAQARFRCRTAIVIDDALKAEAQLRPCLAALLRQDQHLRILLTSRVDPSVDATRDRPTDDILRACAWPEAEHPTRRLARLSPAELARIAPERTEAEIAWADGRPLMVLLGPDPGRTMRVRATELWDAAASSDSRRYLLFAALAAPLDDRTLRAPAGRSFDRRARGTASRKGAW